MGNLTRGPVLDAGLPLSLVYGTSLTAGALGLVGLGGNLGILAVLSREPGLFPGSAGQLVRALAVADALTCFGGLQNAVYRLYRAPELAWTRHECQFLGGMAGRMGGLCAAQFLFFGVCVDRFRKTREVFDIPEWAFLGPLCIGLAALYGTAGNVNLYIFDVPFDLVLCINESVLVNGGVPTLLAHICSTAMLLLTLASFLVLLGTWARVLRLRAKFIHGLCWGGLITFMLTGDKSVVGFPDHVHALFIILTTLNASNNFFSFLYRHTTFRKTFMGFVRVKEDVSSSAVASMK